MPLKKRTASEDLQALTSKSSRVKTETSEDAETEPSTGILTKAAPTSKEDDTTAREPAVQTDTASAEKGKAATNGKQDCETANAIGVVKVNNAGKASEKAKTDDEEAGEAEEDDEKKRDNGPSYWLMKADPRPRKENSLDLRFSIDDLEKMTEPKAWDARDNMLSMSKGDLAFFYHSYVKARGIAGIVEIVKEYSVDETAFDEQHPNYYAKSTRHNPEWYIVHVELRKKLDSVIRLKELQKYHKRGGDLEHMQALDSPTVTVSKVSKEEWEFVCELAGIDAVTFLDT